jgi:hypothetical protein
VVDEARAHFLNRIAAHHRSGLHHSRLPRAILKKLDSFYIIRSLVLSAYPKQRQEEEKHMRHLSQNLEQGPSTRTLLLTQLQQE